MRAFEKKEKKKTIKFHELSLSLSLSLRDISNLNIALIIVVSEDCEEKGSKISLLSLSLDRIRCNIEI